MVCNIPKNHEKVDMCRKCKGTCCKNMPCAMFPSDLIDVSEEMLLNYIGMGFCFDYWEGDFNDELDSCETFYYMRGQEKGKEGQVIHASWGGECVFLKKDGCVFKERFRPLGGRGLIPMKGKGNCIVTDGSSKPDCIKAWIPYNNMIKNVINILEDEDGRD